MAKETVTIIVESPAKARTIHRFLGDGYRVLACMGHLRDLPVRSLGVNVENDFEPTYEVPLKKRALAQSLAREMKSLSLLYIATDYDREGEAIGWHLTQLINAPQEKVRRIVFHEITPEAIREALKSPRVLDENLVAAQQARRVLDRLVGYKISPLLGKNVRRGLSAGRVQSVALRLIAEREREILGFMPRDYYTIQAILEEGGSQFEAQLESFEGKVLQKFDIPTEEEARRILSALAGSIFEVAGLVQKEKQRHPLPPYMTSTLQQDGSRFLGLYASRTMGIAQSLYEEGLITYMRTDSLQVAGSAQAQARRYLESELGKRYAPAAPRIYKTRVKKAQEAHEATRPTSITRTPQEMVGKLDKDRFQLYELIWRRFLASQMSSAQILATTASLSCGRAVFKASGQTILFDGFLKIWKEKEKETEKEKDSSETTEPRPKGRDDTELPPLSVGQKLKEVERKFEKHTTEPLPRFNEASLIRTLEENGVGRPSTYAPILATLRVRDYVRSEGKRLFPQEIGLLVNDLLVKHFPEIVDLAFTAKMESRLDEIAEGRAEYAKVMKEFYRPFEQTVQKASAEMTNHKKPDIPSKEICPKCGASMTIKHGRYGEFLSCSRFPKCKHKVSLAGARTKAPAMSTDEVCEECAKPMVIRTNRRGQRFMACSGFPGCRNTKSLPQKDSEEQGVRSEKGKEKTA